MRIRDLLRFIARMTALIIALAILATAIIPTTTCLAQQREMLRGDRITLLYPSSLSPLIAERFLNNREQALVFAESALGSKVDERITVSIYTSLFPGGGVAFIASIEFHLSLSLLEQFEAPGSVPATTLGCHEETHIVAYYASWGTAATAMKEGLAVYLDGQYRGGATYHLTTLGLLSRGEIPPLDRLLRRVMAPRSSVTDIAAIYSGGASFVAFIIDSYGMETLRAFYAVSWRPLSYLAEDVLKLFGQSLAELEAEWHDYVRRETRGRTYAAELLIDTSIDLSVLINLMGSVEQMVLLDTPAVGRSPLCEQIAQQLYEHRRAVYEAGDDTAVEWAYLRYRAALVFGGKLLATWLSAAEAYTQALSLEGNEPEIQRLLNIALAGYSAVEDTIMLDHVCTLLGNSPASANCRE
ncbi:MAG: hypothetical protein V3T03_07705 [Candidatus Bipolaricaulota bacterium]